MDQPAHPPNETLTSELERLRARVAFLEQLENRQGQPDGEVLYRAIASATPDLLFRLDRHGTYLGVDTANEHMLLFPRERYKGSTLHDTIPPEAADFLLDRIRQVLDTGTMQVIEFQLPGRSGTLEREGRIVPLGPDQVLLIVRDITEKRRTEATLKRLSRQHELILEAAGEGICGVDAQGMTMFVNPAGARMLGYQVDDLIGQPSHSLFHHSRPDGAPYPREECPVAATLREGTTHCVDNEVFWRKDGTGFPVEYTSTPIIEDGQIVGAVLTFRDISERKAAEEALAGERTLLRNLIDNLPDHIYVKDRQGRFTIRNKAGARHMGAASPEEVVGKTDFDYYPPELAERYYAVEQQIIQTGEPIFDLEEPILDAEGNPGWILTTKIPLHDGQGRIIGLVGIGHDVTERIKAEQERMERERLLRTLIDNLPDLIYAKDTESRYILSNAAHARFLGFASPEEVIGKTVFDVYPPELAARYSADDRSVIETGHLIEHEEIGVDSAGHQKWNWVTKVPLRDERGTVIGLVGVARDITERKRTADALAHYAKRLDVLYSLQQSVLAGLSTEEVATEALQGFCRLVPCLSASMALFDFEANTALIVMVGRYGEEVLNPGETVSLDAFRQPDGSLRSEQVIITDLRSRGDSGPIICQKLLGQNIRACLNSPLVVEDTTLGMLVLGSDTVGAFGAAHRVIATQLADQLAVAMSHIRLREQVERHTIELRKRVQERTAELERTRSRVEAILNNSSDAIILARPDSTISQVNLTFDQLFGYEPDELFHRPLTAIAHPTSAKALQEALQAVVREGAIQHLEIVALRKDGSTFDAEVGLSLIEVAEERISGIVCNIHDITQRKRAEAELLEALEKERELSELKTRFVSMASHEFRTPLTTIISSTEILERYSDKMGPEQKSKHFARILTAAQHMTELLEEVLILGRINAGQLQCHPAPLDLEQLAQEALEQAQLTAGPDIEFVVSIESTCPTVNLDEKLMRHILTNLLSNAVKYSPQGGKVYFTLNCGPDHTMIRVQDEGIGIPPKDLERLFEPFHRAENVDTIPGTGLGLAITKQAVDLHGGTITVQSEVDVGTTFTITIPAIQAKMLDEKGA